MTLIAIAFQLLLAFALTLAIECGLCALVCRKSQPVKICFWANLMTNPLLNTTLLLLTAGLRSNSLGAGFTLLVLELCAVLAEGWAYHTALGWRWPRAMGLSLAFNATSFLLGLVLLAYTPMLL